MEPPTLRRCVVWRAIIISEYNYSLATTQAPAADEVDALVAWCESVEQAIREPVGTKKGRTDAGLRTRAVPRYGASLAVSPRSTGGWAS